MGTFIGVCVLGFAYGLLDGWRDTSFSELCDDLETASDKLMEKNCELIEACNHIERGNVVIDKQNEVIAAQKETINELKIQRDELVNLMASQPES